MKDNFSKQAKMYAAFRPGYPGKLFKFLLPLVPGKVCALDCGTGNGQVAAKLAPYFKQVFATDISASQLDLAIAKPNIFYSVERAEATKFPDNTFDLVTVAQAIHWFDFEKFFTEVGRILKPGGIIAMIGYDIFRINKEIDGLVHDFYRKTTGPFWDAERKYIDDHYSTISFPFREIETPGFKMEYSWELEQVTGFLNTWSAVQHYIRKNNVNPVVEFSVQLKEAWGEVSRRKVSFPVFMRTGRN